MKLFSKRILNRYIDDSKYIYRGKEFEFTTTETRNRIVSEIKFLTSSDDFLEWFLLFENQIEEKIFLDEKKVDNFSLSELGYKMTDYFNFEDFEIIKQKTTRHLSISTENRTLEYFDDYKLFDLIEIIMLFSRDDKRINVKNRFNSIFKEENTNFEIIENLITKKSGETLKTVIGILKDDDLKYKIKSYFELITESDYINAAKISADILNIIFSGYIKDDKLKNITKTRDKIVSKLIKNDTKAKEKSNQLKQYIDDMLKLFKNLSNEIYDIRHTEKSTIQITNDNIYKLIATQNIAIIELVITTLKDDYILGDNWEKIKNDYIEKYKIDKNKRLAIKKPEPIIGNNDDINIDNIPF